MTSHGRMLLAALVDVGGTLWPDRLAVHVGPDKCVEQLRTLLPGVDAVRAYDTLRRALRQDNGSLVQDTHGLLSTAVRGLGLNSAEVDINAVRRALCAPAVLGVQLFAGAAELLA